MLVVSAAEHTHQRAAIRDTWAHAAANHKWGAMHLVEVVRVLFVLGSTSSTTSTTSSSSTTSTSLQAILDESDAFGDILLFNMLDSYTNLTLKVLASAFQHSLSLFTFALNINN